VEDTTSTRINAADEIVRLTSYYNPIERCIWLGVHTTSLEQLTVSLFSSNGVLVECKKFYPTAGDNKIKMDVSTYTPGVYILGLQNCIVRKSKTIIIY
jgi:hypothetical protein